ncbi:MATE family efflux transporter [Candidatus Woesearchaeota archaeon CG1_02_57_44]|nr:MAG: MATE family efflux transporter [Candidatus Woesearchaeota archaeon CG1_02_57_44]
MTSTKRLRVKDGDTIKALLGLTLPIVAANILQTAYQLTDTFWVGRLGAGAVAAVSLSFPVFFFVMSIAMGIGVAGSVLVAQYYGAKKPEAIDHAAGQTLVLMLVLSLVCGALGYLLSAPVAKAIGAGPDILADTVAYMQLSFAGILFLFGFFAYQSLVRGVGEVKVPAYIVLGTVLLNLILDPLFIFGYGPIPAYGVTGAALATIGTQGLASIAGLYFLLSGKQGIRLRLKHLKPDWPVVRKLFRIGLPSSIEQGSRALGLVAMMVIVATFGTIIVAAYGIGMRIFSFVIIPAVGLSLGTSTLVGQRMGAGKPDEAEEITRTSYQLGFWILTIIGAMFYIFARPITAFFVPGELEVIRAGAAFLRIMSPVFGFLGIQMALLGALRGAGDTKSSMILSLVSFWVIQLPVAFTLSKYTSLSYSGLWWAFPVSNVLTAILCWWWFGRGYWKHKKIVEYHSRGE